MKKGDDERGIRKQTKQFKLYSKKSHWVKRLDVWPFLFVVYPIWIGFWVRWLIMFTMMKSPHLREKRSSVSLSQDSSCLTFYIIFTTSQAQHIVLSDHPEEKPVAGPLFCLFTGLTVIVHLVAHLSTHWFTGSLCLFAFDPVTDIGNATHVKFIASKPGRKSALAPLLKRDQEGAKGTQVFMWSESFVIVLGLMLALRLLSIKYCRHQFIRS